MTTTNVSTGKPKTTGAVFRAPAGTASTNFPTDANTALNQAFIELGFVSEDGVTNNYSSESDEVKAWGGKTVLVTQSQQIDTWKLKLIETLNTTVLKTVFGDSNVTTGTGTITVNAKGVSSSENCYVIEIALVTGAMKRIVIPCGVISEVGEIVYSDSDAIGYEVTINALPDSSGVTHYEYVKLPTT